MSTDLLMPRKTSATRRTTINNFILSPKIAPKLPITMQIFAVAAAAFAGLALAAPAAEQLDSRQAVYTPCTGLYGSQQCCATDVLGIADLDCGSRE